MHQVFYGKDKNFLLTDEEFSKAALAWDQKKSFYCLRLQALLPPFLTYAEKPPFEVGHNVFILMTQNGSWQRVYERGGTYYQLETIEGTKRLFALPGLQQEETIARLIPQEEFYQEKKYLTS